MVEVSYPGVYVQEIPSGVRPIAAASTSTPAFVGLAEKGPDDEALRITSWTEFQRHYGGYINAGYLAHSVFQFFNNGGQQCYIVRVTPSDAETADVTVQNRASVDGLKFLAKNKGVWGNYLFLQIEDGTADPGNEFRISIRQQEMADLIPEDFLLNVPPLEVYDNLSMDPNASNYVVEVLRQSSNLIEAEVLDSSSVQQGFHRGGGFRGADDLGPTPLPDAGTYNFNINIDNDGYQLVSLTGPLATLAEVATAIENFVLNNLTPLRTSTDFSNFTCTLEDVGTDTEHLLLQSGSSGPTSSVRIQNASTNNAAVSLRLGAGNGGVSESGRAIQRPALAEAIQVGDNAIEAPVTDVTSGFDGDDPLTEVSYRDQFTHLDDKTDFSLLAVPGVGTETMVDEGMGFCERRPLRDVFYIGEMSEDDDSPSDAENFRHNLTKPNSYGAVYFPWIRALDPTGRSPEPILLPPSGYIAGLYARIDSTRGVWKAPAGTEASLSGAVGLGIALTDVQQGTLNRINVNCIRRFPTAGIVSFGARTITSDPEYNYVPVRRLAIMLRVSIYQGIQWAVFEPNDVGLWSQLRLNIGAFMMTLFRQGAFQGSTPSEAFFVKCDSETTTQNDINLGIVNVLVGFAPLKPAEFVVVKISQMAGQAA